MGKLRTVDVGDAKLVNITVKNGVKMFAPTWDMVTDYKKGIITEERYTELYYSLMRYRFRENREYFESFIRDNKKVVIACFCDPDGFCHRFILVKILSAIANSIGEEFVYLGELR